MWNNKLQLNQSERRANRRGSDVRPHFANSENKEIPIVPLRVKQKQRPPPIENLHTHSVAHWLPAQVVVDVARRWSWTKWLNKVIMGRVIVMHKLGLDH